MNSQHCGSIRAATARRDPDVWSQGEVQPVRIEFFGDEIDTMRIFDPATQRTVDKIESLTARPPGSAAGGS